MSKKRYVLPADMYDALEFSAFVYGGIGAGSFTRVVNGFEKIPCCIYGHARDLQPSIYGNETPAVNDLTTALRACGISTFVNDAAVNAILHRHPARLFKQVSFDEWCRELNVVRGSDKITVSQAMKSRRFEY